MLKKYGHVIYIQAMRHDHVIESHDHVVKRDMNQTHAKCEISLKWKFNENLWFWF